MTETRTRLSAARRYLDVLEESWKADHDTAMRRRAVEEKLAEATKVFELVDELVRLRRESVFRGLQDPVPQLDEEEKTLYAEWLALVEPDFARLEELEQTNGVIEGAERYRSCREKARTFLAKWHPAVPAMAVGSRVIEFSEEDADQIHAVLHSPAGSPGRPTHPPRSVSEGDPSLLR
jgi:hypothetical protein